MTPQETVERFEKAVREHEMRGSQHPADSKGISEEYRNAKVELLSAVSTHNITHETFGHVELKITITLGNKCQFGVCTDNKLWAMQYGPNHPVSLVPLGEATFENVDNLTKLMRRIM